MLRNREWNDIFVARLSRDFHMAFHWSAAWSYWHPLTPTRPKCSGTYVAGTNIGLHDGNFAQRKSVYLFIYLVS